MPSWKKILQSGSAVHVLNITASSLPNLSQPNIIGYDTASGRFTYFSTSSLGSGGSTIGGSGTTNYITRWSSGTSITTSSIYESGSRIGIGTGAVLPNATLQIVGTLNNGINSTASGDYSHAEGISTLASGIYSHAEGQYTTAEGYGSKAIGSYTYAKSNSQFVIGRYNNTSSNLPNSFIIGNGIVPINHPITVGARKNLVEIKPNSNVSDFFGPVRITRTEETSTQDPDTLRDQNKAGIIYMGFTHLFNTQNRGSSPPIAVKVNNTATAGTNYGTLKHPKPSAGTVSYYTKVSHTSTNAIGASIQSANINFPYDVINTGIFTDGAVTAQEFRALGSSQISSTSDIRLKENINDVDIDTALKLIENVKPVTFNWKRPEVGDNSDTINGKFDVGVIAQDVLKNGFEHLVRIAENTLVPEHIDDEGYVSKEGYEFGVSYVGMIPYHAKVIKYLLDEIRELKSQVKALEEK